MFENFPQFKEEYNKTYNNEFGTSYSSQIQSSLTLLNSNLQSSNQTASESSLDELVKNLKISKTAFIALSAAASIAATGFFIAAVFSGGATVAWGAGCSAVAAIFGGVAAGCDIALTKYDQERSNIKNAFLSVDDIIKLGRVIYSVLYASLVTAKTEATILSCFFPSALSVIGIISTILSLLDLFKSC